MQFSKWENIFVVLIMTAILTAGISFALRDKVNFISQAAAVSNNTSTAASQIPVVSPPPPPPPQKLSNPPEIIKSVYVTGYSAGIKSYLNYLSLLFKNTEINAVVVDIKGSDGRVSYASAAGDVKKYNLTDYAIPDIDALVKFFHDQNIYVIGRIAVFEDPVYAKARPSLAIYDKTKTTDLSAPVLWRDNNGISWLDPASKDVWDYDISLAKDAFYNGFDEVNFDYVRFPSDGKMENAGYPVWDQKVPMSETIKNFFQYIRNNLPDEKISVDLFGLTTVNSDDMGIGQVIENAFETFDYVSPMVYPSHYANGFIGFSNPAEHPYDVIKYSMTQAEAKEQNF
ncbi:MAG: putative glycoside hydrolase, partial [Candidatus Staskawiczbacteria bacterium]